MIKVDSVHVPEYNYNTNDNDVSNAKILPPTQLEDSIELTQLD